MPHATPRPPAAARRLRRGLLTASAVIGLTFPALPPWACPPGGTNPGAPTTLFVHFGTFSASGVNLELDDEDGKPVPLDVTSSGYPGPVSAQVEICERVAEEYAPFHVNVTRDVPPDVEDPILPDWRDRFTGGEAIMIVVGLTQEQMGSLIRGGERDGASDLDRGLRFVPYNDGGQARTPKDLAQSAAHDSGHLFSFRLSQAIGGDFYFRHRAGGLQVPSAIMGTHYNDRPEFWDRGPYLGGRDVDEIAVLFAYLGLRPDDHTDWAPDGTPLVLTNPGSSGPRVLGHAGRAVVAMNDESWPRPCAPWGDPSCDVGKRSFPDTDFFRFLARRGSSFTAEVQTLDQLTGLAYAGNLSADLELWRRVDDAPDAAWELVRDGADELGEDGSAALWFTPEHVDYREYALGVKSPQGYDALGQFRLTVSGDYVRAVN